jgi:hypothetical protein
MEVDLSQVRHRVAVPTAAFDRGQATPAVAIAPPPIAARTYSSSPASTPGAISTPASGDADEDSDNLENLENLENLTNSAPGHVSSSRGGGAGGGAGVGGGGASMPWLHVVGVDVLEACAAKSLYLPYLSLSPSETRPEIPSSAATSSTSSATGSRGTAANARSTAANARSSAANARSSAANATASLMAATDSHGPSHCGSSLQTPPHLPAGGGGKSELVRGGAGCNVVLTNALVGMEVCCYFLVLDSRLNRRNKKQV